MSRVVSFLLVGLVLVVPGTTFAESKTDEQQIRERIAH